MSNQIIHQDPTSRIVWESADLGKSVLVNAQDLPVLLDYKRSKSLKHPPDWHWCPERKEIYTIKARGKAYFTDIAYGFRCQKWLDVTRYPTETDKVLDFTRENFGLKDWIDDEINGSTVVEQVTFTQFKDGPRRGERVNQIFQTIDDEGEEKYYMLCYDRNIDQMRKKKKAIETEDEKDPPHYYVLIDKVIVDTVGRYTGSDVEWYRDPSCGKIFSEPYKITKSGKKSSTRSTIWLSQAVKGYTETTQKGKAIDHYNHDPLDCRLQNLMLNERVDRQISRKKEMGISVDEIIPYRFFQKADVEEEEKPPEPLVFKKPRKNRIAKQDSVPTSEEWSDSILEKCYQRVEQEEKEEDFEYDQLKKLCEEKGWMIGPYPSSINGLPVVKRHSGIVSKNRGKKARDVRGSEKNPVFEVLGTDGTTWAYMWIDKDIYVRIDRDMINDLRAIPEKNYQPTTWHVCGEYVATNWTRNPREYTSLSMHQYLTGHYGNGKGADSVDHLNQDKMDNRMCNLKIKNQSEQNYNRGNITRTSKLLDEKYVGWANKYKLPKYVHPALNGNGKNQKRCWKIDKHPTLLKHGQRSRKSSVIGNPSLDEQLEEIHEMLKYLNQGKMPPKRKVMPTNVRYVRVRNPSKGNKSVQQHYLQYERTPTGEKKQSVRQGIKGDELKEAYKMLQKEVERKYNYELPELPDEVDLKKLMAGKQR